MRYLAIVVEALTLLQLISIGSCQKGPLFVRKSPSSPLFSSNTTRFPIVFRNPVTPPPISSTRSVSSVVDEAVALVNDEDATMRRRLLQDIDQYPKDFTNPDPLLFSESPEDAENFSRQSRIINWLARLLRKYGLRVSLATALSGPAARRHSLSCPYKPPVTCERYTRYRTVGGSCNNLNNNLWGAAFTPFVRLLPPRYERRGDRDDAMPGPYSSLSSHLPTARVVSTAYHEPARGDDDSPFTMLLTVFGQFLSHDLTDRAPTKGFNNSVLKCCDQDISTPDGFCENIAIPLRDNFRRFSRDCLEFPRSLEVTDLTCSSGVREQLNQASSFIDGGAIYGATEDKSDSLREFKGGLLMMSVPRELPIMPHGNVQATTRGFAYYAAGDNRVNEFIGLIAMETMWVREHNRIATKLAKINPHWEDETVFQETKRIVVAIIQHITYSEYLPAVLGPELMGKYELGVLPTGRYREYDPRVNPGLTNAFATAAMRFGHSMLRTTFSMIDRQRKRNGDTPVDLKDSFFRPQTYLTHENPLVRGMAVDSSKICDRVLSGSVINNLYETEPGNGADLAASNIQRGRDHGLPGYAQWRRHFGLRVPKSFDKSSTGFTDINADDVAILSTIYRSPSDVDLFTGGVSEKPVQHGAVGPLFGNIIGQQFKTLKTGDRFWYETNAQPQAFTDAQLSEIRKITLARVLCYSYSFNTIQRRAFHVPESPGNTIESCSDIPSIDLDYWEALP